MQDQKNTSSPLLLVYYSFKGLAQVARQLLCYLDLPFLDIHLDRYQQQKKELPHQIVSSLKGVQIHKHNLPLLIHEGHFIYQLQPILSYLCYRFNREDLLGRDYKQRARVQELTELYREFLYSTKKMLFNFADIVEGSKKGGLELMALIEKGYYHIIDNSGYMLEISQFLVKQNKITFILDTLTILDFYYMQSSNYMIGLFGSLDRETDCERWKQMSCQYSEFKREHNQQIRSLKNLEYMREYAKFMRSQPYYIKHKEFLCSHKVIGSYMSDLRINGLRKAWAADYQEVTDKKV